MGILKRMLLAFGSRVHDSEPSVPPTADETSETEPEHYADDAPIASSNEDRFSRWPFAERIAHVIATRTDPASIVIGIYGPWGDGKTSVLNMMREALATRPNVICIPFNPWHFENHQQLIRAFFGTLSDGLGKTLTTKGERAGEVLQKYGHLLALAGLSGAAELGEKLSTVEVEQLKDRLSELLVESGRRFVVLIDDVDRLDRAEIHAILRLVKLSGGFSNTTYVLACDDTVVAASLGERYGAGGTDAGRQFLEKIVQVPLHLPDAEILDLRALSFDGVDEVLKQNDISLTEEQVEAFALHFQRGILPAVHTPRQVKRFVNAIRFAVPLLKGEVNVVDQLLVEGVRTTFPNLYLSLRENRDTYLGSELEHGLGDNEKKKQASKAVVEAGLTGLAEAESAAALEVLKALFPRMETIFGNTSYGNDSDDAWANEQRIASDAYFRRYFQYAVPLRDIPDAEVARLVDAVIRDTAESSAMFDRVDNRRAWSRFIDKLFEVLQSLDDNGRARLAIALSRQGHRVPKDARSIFQLASSWNRATVLIGKMVKNVAAPPLRVETAREVVASGADLPFVAECFRSMGVQGSREGAGTALGEAEKQEIGAVLAERIATTFAQETDFTSLADLGSLLWLWKTYGTAGASESFLRAQFDRDPNRAVSFVKRFMGKAIGLETGLSQAVEFDRDSFNNMASIIEPEIVYGALRGRYGPQLDGMTFEKAYRLEGGERVAAYFAALFLKVQAERAQKEKAAAPDSGRPSEASSDE